MKPSILILSYHFFPAPSVGAKRPTSLARALADNGYDVVVVASKPKDPESRVADGVQMGQNIRVIHIWDPPSVEDSLFGALRTLRGRFGVRRAKIEPETGTKTAAPGNRPTKERLAEKLLRHFHSLKLTFGTAKAWATLAFFRILPLRFSRQFDLIISSGPPMVAHISASLLKRVFRARHIIDLRDPWNEGPNQRSVYRSKARLKLEDAVRRRCYAASELIVCASPGTQRTVQENWPSPSANFRIILNGYDTVAEDPVPSPTGVLHILFAGTIYLNRDPFPLFHALAELLDDPLVDRSKVRLDMYGDCKTFADIDLAQWLTQNGLSDCIFLHAPVSPKEIREQIARSTVLLNFAQGQKNQIPAKTYEYLATGRQTLVITEPDSDTASIVLKSGMGIIVPPDDPQLMRTTIRDLYEFFVTDKKTHQFSADNIDHFSRKAQNRLYLGAIEELVR